SCRGRVSRASTLATSAFSGSSDSTCAHVSPAGLTPQVGFIRLAHLKRPKSDKPDFGWSIFLRKNAFAKKMDCTATRACPSCAVLCAASRVNPTCGVKPGKDGSGIETSGTCSRRPPLTAFAQAAELHGRYLLSAS